MGRKRLRPNRRTSDVVERSKALKIGGVALALVLVAGIGGVFFLSTGYDKPTVQSVESEFGQVTNETSVVVTDVVVVNPNDRQLPSATIRFKITMNDVTMATGSEPGVRLQPGRNELELRAELDNARIPDWWVTHIERGERTVMTSKTSASFASLPFGLPLPTQNRTIDSDIVASFTNETERSFVLDETPIMNVTDQRASWGEPTQERSPIKVRTTLVNRHNRTVTIDGIAYTVRMNDAVVGSGVDEGLVLTPGERRTVTVDIGIDTPKMQQWWVSHLRRDQTTRLAVDLGAVATSATGEQGRIPLAALGTRATFRTDVFGPNETVVESLPTEDGPGFERPTAGNASNRWGEPTDEVTPILTEIPVRNANEGNVTDLLAVTVGQRTTIADMVVADNETSADLVAGDQTVRLRSVMRNDQVPNWWARHVNGGENSTVVTTASGEADVGITTFPINRPDRRRFVQTDVLAGLNNDTSQPVSVEGRTILVIEQTRADWGTATPEEAPIDVRLRVRNQGPSEATIRDINYTVRLNDVTLADRTSPDTFTVPAGETRTLETTMRLNNSRMADWWPTHVRRDEQSVFAVRSFATVETNRETKRVELESVSTNTTVRTDLLGSDSS